MHGEEKLIYLLNLDLFRGFFILAINNNIKRLEALQNIMPSIPLVSPLDYYWVSSNFGKRKDPINKRNAMHYGIDLVAQTSTSIMATAPGIITFAGIRARYGKMVEVDHGYGIKTRYGHLHKITKKKGEEVDFQEEIGKLGSSGRVTGPHIHYEILYDYKTICALVLFAFILIF